MSIYYEVVPDYKASCIRGLCNELMAYQKSKSCIHSELFDGMSFETRMIPSMESAKVNYIMVAKDRDDIIGYVYSNIAPKEVYSNEFATFF